MRLGLYPELLLVFLVTGCATDRTEYANSPGSPRLSRETAQNALVGKPLDVQFKTPLDAPLIVLAATLPVYPREFAQANLVGTVRLRFSIEHDGTVSDVAVLGSPPAPLAAICVNAMLQWKFTPPKRDGKPVKLRLERDIGFQLE